MFRILFLCTGKSGRSTMAAAFAEQFAYKHVEIISAADKRHKLSDEAREAMSDINIELPDKVKNSLADIKNGNFDLVITLCNKAREICPIFPGSPARVHWPLLDPESVIDDKERKEKYIQTRDELRSKIDSLLNCGFIESMRETRLLFKTLLNNLTDGIFAHDLDRKIFFVNDAALKITGYKREEIIGKDCHLVFPGRFCGGDCSFCDDSRISNPKYRFSRLFVRKNGDRLNLEMSIVTLAPPGDRVIGVLVIFRDISEVIHLKKRLEESRGFHGIIGRHISMQKVFDSIRELADVNVPILIQGETGTGKELVATALHQISKRSSGPFVPVNCGALPEGTLESELFGHVKGAFTGAVHDRKGRFELAEGGTLFLDEIGEISQAMQVKLLRVLQENCFVPVGGEKLINVNVRVICATNRDLRMLTKQGLFREDLYYRLAVVPVNMPTLRERQSDIRTLVEYFLDKFSGDIGRKVRDISPDALEILENYNWPGNVRELSNAMQYSMIKCEEGNVIQPFHLPPEILDYTAKSDPVTIGRPKTINSDTVKEVLERTGGNKAKAAKILGISRTSIYRLLNSELV